MKSNHFTRVAKFEKKMITPTKWLSIQKQFSRISEKISKSPEKIFQWSRAWVQAKVRGDEGKNFTTIQNRKKNYNFDKRCKNLEENEKKILNILNILGRNVK